MRSKSSALKTHEQVASYTAIHHGTDTFPAQPLSKTQTRLQATQTLRAQHCCFFYQGGGAESCQLVAHTNSQVSLRTQHCCCYRQLSTQEAPTGEHPDFPAAQHARSAGRQTGSNMKKRKAWTCRRSSYKDLQRNCCPQCPTTAAVKGPHAADTTPQAVRTKPKLLRRRSSTPRSNQQGELQFADNTQKRQQPMHHPAHIESHRSKECREGYLTSCPRSTLTSSTDCLHS